MALAFKLNEKFFIRDPQETELGRKIIQHGIELIDRLGFEQFTFRKLAEEIGSAEASLYRYFENKHRLLTYLAAWYWSWTEYRMDLLTHPTQLADEKLRWCLRVLTEKKKNDQAFGFVDEEALYRIIIKEQDKTWLTKWVDDDNRSGFFRGYKSICKKMAELIRECNPAYPYPSSLVSTVMMTSLHQMFYAEHLPSLSDLHKDDHEQLYTFVENLVFSTLRK
ncbi:MAG: TetR/AcrR family transcriptional regulator [Cyclobacteriaceae bacterium]|jgi:AcrR family transcriptional regulator